MNAKAVAAIRAAYIPAFTSAAFKADATKILTYVPRPVGHERAEKVLAAITNMSPDDVAFIKATVDKHRPK
jgi:two-component SAPR family response regulator